MSFHRDCTNSLLNVCYVNIDCTGTEAGMFTARLCLGLFSYFRTVNDSFTNFTAIYTLQSYIMPFNVLYDTRYFVITRLRFPDFPRSSSHGKHRRPERKSREK